jgi:3-oxoacyl-[acyl-carrier protein] reductase
MMSTTTQTKQAVLSDKLSMEGQTALVTGAAMGIGRAIAETLHDAGANLILLDPDPALDEFAAELEEERAGSTWCRGVDVSDQEQVIDTFTKAAESFGSVDVLVNNAGITGGNAKTWELEPEIWRRVIEVNLVGPYLTCRSVVPDMLKNGYGRIVNIASIAGKEGNPNASHYSASKAGVIALTKSLGKELATSNILVNCITPAAARTEIFNQMKQEHIDFMLSKIPMNRFLEVKEAASLIGWLSSEDCAFSTGAVFDISGGRATY